MKYNTSRAWNESKFSIKETIKVQWIAKSSQLWNFPFYHKILSIVVIAEAGSGLVSALAQNKLHEKEYSLKIWSFLSELKRIQYWIQNVFSPNPQRRPWTQTPNWAIENNSNVFHLWFHFKYISLKSFQFLDLNQNADSFNNSPIKSSKK